MKLLDNHQRIAFYVERAVLCCDLAIAFWLFMFWSILILPLALIRLAGGGKSEDKTNERIVFFSYEGYKVAPTRVRCYHFCEGVKQLGLDAKVYAYWDQFNRLATFPFPFRRIWETEKILMNMITFFKFLPQGRTLIYEQRPNYDFLVPLFLKLVNGSQVVMDIDDWIFDYHVFNLLRVKHLLPLLGKYCKTCVVSSHHLQEKLSSYFDQVILIPTYVDVEKFRPATEKSENKTLLLSWVGTIFQDFTYDNVIFVIESVARACKKLGNNNHLRLEIVGGGDYFPKVAEKIREDYNDINVVLRNWLPPEKMPNYLQNTDIGLYSLVEPSDFHRSKSPTKIFEYLACGVPVVATDLGEARYLLEQGITGFLAADAESFSDSIVRLYKDPGLRMHMGSMGRKQVMKHFNQSVACSKLKEVISQSF